MAASEIFTIGHSTHSAEQFIELLGQHAIQALADIRRFPSSQRCPQFNRPALEAMLTKAGVEYRWLEALGGRRAHEKGLESPNPGLRNPSFRNYADYMRTDAFQQGFAALLELAAQKRTAIMCAENVFWRCHRRLVSDLYVARGGTVQHIFPNGELKPHALTEGAKVKEGTVTYPGDATLFDK